MSATFSAADIVGKTLYAKKAVPAKRSPWDDIQPYRTIQPGYAVGRVESWVEPRAGRRNLHWEIDNGNERFWVEHQVGVFDTNALQAQGLQSNEQLAWQEKPWYQKAAIQAGATFAAIWFLLNWQKF